MKYHNENLNPEEHFFIVKQWMTSKLKLKGSELLVFAVIYGFSQSKKGKYTGSGDYIKRLIGLSREKTVYECLKKLCEKNLLIKEDNFYGRINMPNYMVNFEKVSEIRSTSAENVSIRKTPFEDNKNGMIKAENVCEEAKNGSTRAKNGYNNIDNNIYNTIYKNIKEKSENKFSHPFENEGIEIKTPPKGFEKEKEKKGRRAKKEKEILQTENKNVTSGYDWRKERDGIINDEMAEKLSKVSTFIGRAKAAYYYEAKNRGLSYDYFGKYDNKDLGEIEKRITQSQRANGGQTDIETLDLIFKQILKNDNLWKDGAYNNPGHILKYWNKYSNEARKKSKYGNETYRELRERCEREGIDFEAEKLRIKIEQIHRRRSNENGIR